MVCPLCEKVLCNKWRLESHLVSKHKMEKEAIIEKEFLHFQRRNTNKGSVRKACTPVGKKSDVENKKYSKNRDSHASGLKKRNKGKNVRSGPEVTIPATNAGHTNTKNIHADDCFERPNCSVITSENNSNVCILYKESKSQADDTGVKNVDNTMDLTEKEEEIIGVKYNLTISDISIDSTDRDSNVILKNVCYDPCREQFTLHNMLDKSNETKNSEIIDRKTNDGSTVENFRDSSINEYKVSESSQELGVHSSCVFSNNDIDSENTCSVDLSESGSLVDDVTDSYEVLQHEFDEIPDTAENDEVQQEDTPLVLRSSSAALQEYFARYNNVLERKHIAPSRLKAPAFVSEETYGTDSDRLVNKVGSYLKNPSLTTSTPAFRHGLCSPSTEKLGLYDKDHYTYDAIGKDNSQTKILSSLANISKAVENEKDNDLRAAETSIDSSYSKNEMCFKHPESPFLTLPKKRQPRLYSVTSKCMKSLPTKYAQESARIMTMSEKEVKGKCFVNYTYKTEIPAGNGINNMPNNYQVTDDRGNAISDAVNWSAQSKNLRTRKVPLIFRISNCSSVSQNSLYTGPGNTGSGSVATSVWEPDAHEKFTPVDKTVSDSVRQELKRTQEKWS